MLLSPEWSLVFEKDSDKEDLVETFGSGYGRVTFILLNNIIVVHVRLLSIYVRCFSFLRSFLEFVKVFRCKGLGI